MTEAERVEAARVADIMIDELRKSFRISKLSDAGWNGELQTRFALIEVYRLACEAKRQELKDFGTALSKLVKTICDARLSPPVL